MIGVVVLRELKLFLRAKGLLQLPKSRIVLNGLTSIASEAVFVGTL